MQGSFDSPDVSGISITLHKAMRCVLDAKWHCERSKSPYSRLYFIKEGNGVLQEKNGKETPLHSGVVAFIPAECEFSYRCTHLEKLFFHLSVTRADQYDLFAGVDRILTLPLTREQYAAAEAAVEGKDAFSCLRLHSLLLAQIVEFIDTYALPSATLPTYSPLVRRIIECVLQNVAISLTVKEIATALYLSESKIRNAFRSETGIPLGKYIDDMVFMKAKKLLADKSIHIAQISEALGFCDAFYFSRRFKQKFGKTPSAFRVGIV